MSQVIFVLKKIIVVKGSLQYKGLIYIPDLELYLQAVPTHMWPSAGVCIGTAVCPDKLINKIMYRKWKVKSINDKWEPWAVLPFPSFVTLLVGETRSWSWSADICFMMETHKTWLGKWPLGHAASHCMNARNASYGCSLSENRTLTKEAKWFRHNGVTSCCYP